MRQFLRYFTILTLVFLCGCSTVPQGEEFVIPKDKGAVILKLAAAKVKTRATTATDFVHPSADEFNITFVSEAMDTVFQKPFTEFPYALVLPAGNYKALAEYGKNVPFSLDMPYYRSEQLFVVEMGQTTDIDMKAVLHSFIVQINYSADFADYFTTFSVVGEVEGGDTYTFAADASGSAYFAPCTLRLVLKGVLKDGAPYSSIIQEFSSTGTELHKLNIRVLPRGHSFDVDIDRSVTLVDITSTVPDEFLPDMPAILPLEISTYETADITANTELAINSVLKLKDICVAPSASLKAFFGITQDTLRASVDQDAAILDMLGINAAALIGAQNGMLNFNAVTSKLLSQNNVATRYSFGIKAQDVLGMSSGGDVDITINPTDFSLLTLPGLTRTMEFVATPAVDNADRGKASVINSKIKWSISTDGSIFADFTPSVGNLFTGLLPNTKYYVRADYRDGAIVKTAVVTTEDKVQMPNSNLDSWTSYNPVSNNPTYSVGDGKWWATRNTMTNSEGGNYFYCRMSGTKPIDAVSGKGAELLTIGWGSGNTCAMGGSISSSSVANISAATLFVGEYDGGEKQGKPFTSKPSSLNFHYHYDPYSGDYCTAQILIKNGEQIIGQGTFKANQYVANFTAQSVDVVYDPQYYHLAPTTICVLFKSGDNEGSKDYLKDWVNYGGAFWAGYSSQGSKFYVDEISLGYEK